MDMKINSQRRTFFVFTCLFVFMTGFLLPKVAAAPVVIEMARSIRAADAAWQEAVIEAFNAKHDHIQVELSGGGEGLGHGKLTVLLIAGEAPHIIYQDPNNLLNWARQGFLVDLVPYLEREPADSPFNDFFDIVWDFYTLDGQIFGSALDLQTQALMYNEDAFNEAGQAPPHEGWTWDDLAAIGQKVMKRTVGDGPPERWGLRNPQWFHWWSAIWHYGGAIVDDWSKPREFTGDSNEVRESMRMYQNLVSLGVMAPPGTFGTGGSAGTSANVAAHGHSAMGLANSLYMQTAIPLGHEYNSNWNVASLPAGPYGNVAITNALGWGIVNEAGNTDEAFEVLRFFSGPEAMELAVHHRPGAVLPHRPTMIDVWLPTNTVPSNRHVLLDALPTSRQLPLIPDADKNIVQRAAFDFWNARISEDQMIENMRTGINSWIQANPF